MILTYLKLDLATYWQFPINGICLVFACPSVNVLVRVSCFLVINLIGLYDVYFYLLRFVFHISSKDNIAILLIQLRLYEHFCYESTIGRFLIVLFTNPNQSQWYENVRMSYIMSRIEKVRYRRVSAF